MTSIDDFPKNIQKNIRKACKEGARLYRKRLIRNIRTNKFQFTLSQATLMRRIAMKRKKIPLIDTGEFIVHILYNDTKVSMMDGKHKKGLTFEELSNILEYGRKDRSVRAFPVWAKTWEEVQPEISQIFKKYLLL